MGKVYSNGVTLPTGFKREFPAPGFDDEIWEFISDLDTIPNQFIGMKVIVLETEELYVKKTSGWKLLSDSDNEKLHRVYVENNLSETIQTTGTSGAVVFHTITFPANYFPDNCVCEATISLSAVGTNGIKNFSAGFVLASVTFPFHSINVPAINQQVRATRTFTIKNGKISSYGTSGSFYHDFLVFNFPPPKADFNVANSHDFIIKMDSMNASDLIKLESLIIKVYKP